MHITDMEVDFDIQGMTVQFDNLFGGNKVLGECRILSSRRIRGGCGLNWPPRSPDLSRAVREGRTQGTACLCLDVAELCASKLTNCLSFNPPHPQSVVECLQKR